MSMKTELAAAATNPSAGEHVGGIEDLITEILFWLPAKSLIRFKAVSKQWLSLVSDPKFTQSHVLRRNPRNPPSGMFVTDANSWKIDFFWLDEEGITRDQESACGRAGPYLDFLYNVFNGYYGKLHIVQSCNGLLLCRPRCINSRSLCVCNPTTKQYRVLDQPTIVGWTVSGVGFGFDPSISPHYKVVCVKYLPCLVSVGDHYMVVCVGWTFRVEVYSSEDHQWRLLLEFQDSKAEPRDNYSDGVFFDGGIHWLSHHSFHFDLNSESLVQRPKPFWRGSRVRMRGKYAYLESYLENKQYVCELSNDNREWVMKYIIDISRLTSAYPEIVSTEILFGNYNCSICVVVVLDVVEGTKEEDSELLLIIHDKIVSYNLMRHTMKTVYNIPDKSSTIHGICSYPFIETLSLV